LPHVTKLRPLENVAVSWLDSDPLGLGQMSGLEVLQIISSECGDAGA
jgi:hypothetical protein